MQISDQGLVFTKSFEGLRLAAYYDSAGIITIGYGHTGVDVRPGLVITEVQATAFLRSDMAVAEHCVTISVHVPLNQNQFDALVDFCFNAGIGAFLGSTLREFLNQGRYDEVPAQLLRWNHAGGEVSEGLTRRRQAEAALFVKAVSA